MRTHLNIARAGFKPASTILTAALALAIAFTFSCSDDKSDDGGGGGWNGTSGTFTDSRDSKAYKWVKIGEQIWMAENLNYNASGSYCYGNQTSNCNTYGRLYNWSTAMGGAASSSRTPSGVQGVCPSGWHIPSDAEWGTLMQSANPSCSLTATCAYAGTRLKSASGWNSYSGIPSGTDNHGFSALPGGNGSSGTVGYVGNWWTSTEKSSTAAYCRCIYYDDEDTYWHNEAKGDLHSVRCVKD